MIGHVSLPPLIKKREGGGGAQMCPASFPLYFFSYSLSIHMHKAMGAYYFVSPLEQVTFGGL